MLALTKKTEYALIAICHMARDHKRIVSAREIAAEHNLPLPLLMNVLKKLNQAGHVNSVRGARGGYNLAVRSRDLSVAAVVEAVEGPVRFVNCVPGPTRSRRRCARASACALRLPIHKIHERLLAFLSAVSVADLAFDRDYARAATSAHRAVAP